MVIFVDDHDPAHVHVFGDGQAKIQLEGARGGVEIVWTKGMSRAEDRKALRLVRDQRQFLQTRWEEFHGRAD